MSCLNWYQLPSLPWWWWSPWSWRRWPVCNLRRGLLFLKQAADSFQSCSACQCDCFNLVIKFSKKGDDSLKSWYVFRQVSLSGWKSCQIWKIECFPDGHCIFPDSHLYSIVSRINWTHCLSSENFLSMVHQLSANIKKELNLKKIFWRTFG